MINVLAVGFGGLIGSCGRYGLTKLMERLAFSFPLSTLVSNVLAALLIGFIIGIERQLPLPARVSVRSKPEFPESAPYPCSGNGSYPGRA